jgi:hypothetical protein
MVHRVRIECQENGHTINATTEAFAIALAKTLSMKMGSKLTFDRRES